MSSNVAQQLAVLSQETSFDATLKMVEIGLDPAMRDEAVAAIQKQGRDSHEVVSAINLKFNSGKDDVEKLSNVVDLLQRFPCVPAADSMLNIAFRGEWLQRPGVPGMAKKAVEGLNAMDIDFTWTKSRIAQIADAHEEAAELAINIFKKRGGYMEFSIASIALSHNMPKPALDALRDMDNEDSSEAIVRIGDGIESARKDAFDILKGRTDAKALKGIVDLAAKSPELKREAIEVIAAHAGDDIEFSLSRLADDNTQQQIMGILAMRGDDSSIRAIGHMFYRAEDAAEKLETIIRLSEKFSKVTDVSLKKIIEEVLPERDVTTHVVIYGEHKLRRVMAAAAEADARQPIKDFTALLDATVARHGGAGMDPAILYR